MTPKDLAVKDMEEDLSKENRSFLAFHNELNYAMRRLVSKQIKEQIEITNPSNMPVRHKPQLIARCFFCKDNIKYENYSKYYENK